MDANQPLISALRESLQFIKDAVEAGILNADEVKESPALQLARETLAKFEE